MKSIAVSANDKIHNLNQLSSSRKYLRPIARYSQNCCRNRRLKNKVFILMSSSRMFVSRPERDNQNYLNTTQCRVSEIFIRGTSSKESRPTVCLLWDSGELCVLFSDEGGQAYYKIHPFIYLETPRPCERDIKAPVLQSDLWNVIVWDWVFSLKYIRPRKVENRMRKSK